MGHVWVGAALALRAARFMCASAVRLFSAARAPVETLLRQVGRSRASDSHVLGLMLLLLTNYNYGEPHTSMFGNSCMISCLKHFMTSEMQSK